MTDAATLARRIAQGRGDEPADLVIRGAQLFDLVSGDLIDTVRGVGYRFRE